MGKCFLGLVFSGRSCLAKMRLSGRFDMYLTEKQSRILEFVQDERNSTGLSPTLEEIADHLGTTKITIFGHINQLERKGAVTREKFRARSLELTQKAAEHLERFRSKRTEIIGEDRRINLPPGTSITLPTGYRWRNGRVVAPKRRAKPTHITSATG